jgi:MFS family permease
MYRSVRWYDYITININWFALTARSQVLTPLIIPLLVQQFVGEATKGARVGEIRLYALMLAILVQAFMGMVSDRSQSRWGRRRPFIFIGTIGEVIVFAAIGFVAGLEGMTGYWVLFALYLLSMLTSNTSHAATQGLIPDLVPDDKKGAFSGVKALMELPFPLVFVSFVIANIVAGGNLIQALLVLSGTMLFSMAITMFVPEKRLDVKPAPMDWAYILRLLVMTVAFTMIILGVGQGVKWFTQIGNGIAGLGGLLLVGAAGLIGMTISVIIGVIISIRISMGKEAKASRSFTWWVVNRLAFLVAANNLATFLVFFLQERFSSFSASEAAKPAANVILFVGVFIILSAVPGGWLADRFGKKKLLVFAAIIPTLGVMLVVFGPGMTAIYAGASLVGIGTGLFYSVNWALGTAIVPKEKAGQYLGLQNLAGAGAGAVGAYIGGPIADNTSYVLLMTIYGLMFLLSIVALAGIKEQSSS